MREIKFRAWGPRLSGEKMIYDGFAVNAEGEAMYVGYDNYGFDGDEVVMQYTGLLDKNGKEIYEGDILESSDPMDDRGVVEWYDQCQEAFKEREVYLDKVAPKLYNSKMI